MARIKLKGKIVCGELEGINVWTVEADDPYAKPRDLWKALSDLYFNNQRNVKITIELIEKPLQAGGRERMTTDAKKT